MMQRLSSRYRAHTGGASRLLEDVAFLVGVLLIGAKGTVEILQGAAVFPAQEHGLWTIVVEFLRSSLLVAPKMLGKATGGRAWGAAAAGLGRLLGRGKAGDE